VFDTDEHVTRQWFAVRKAINVVDAEDTDSAIGVLRDIVTDYDKNRNFLFPFIRISELIPIDQKGLFLALFEVSWVRDADEAKPYVDWMLKDYASTHQKKILTNSSS